MIKTLTVTEASRNFSEVVNRALYRGETTLLLKGGRPVARIVPVAPATVTGGAFAALWADLPHLDASEAEAFVHDLDSARSSLPEARDPWA